MKRIIDNKRIDLTTDEYSMYESICRSYDRPNFKGEELFKGHFQTNEHGIITQVIPPHNRQTSHEVFQFLISIQNNQHNRINRDMVLSLIKEAGEKIKQLVEHAEKLQSKLDDILKNSSEK